MKSLIFFVFIFFAFFTMSCNKSQNEGSGTGDVLIVAKKSGTNTVYGLSIYAYTFSSFKSVQVDNGDNSTKRYELKSNQGYNTNFYYEAPEIEFTTSKPFASTYLFSATFENGASDIFDDILTDKVLAIPTIDKTEYISASKELGVSWTPVAGADSYNINILDGSTLVYSSPELLNSLKYFAVNPTAIGWLTGFAPVDGKTYTVRLKAFLYEPSGNSYNMQAVSMTEKTIVKWGE